MTRTLSRPSKLTKLTKGKRQYRKNKMLTSHQLRNFINDNTLQDWLERHYHGDQANQKYQIKTRDFQKLFRDQVISHIRSQVDQGQLVELERPVPVPALGSHSGEEMAKLLNGCETLKLMREHIPVIANAQLINRSEGICDIADLIIRSDYIQRLFPQNMHIIDHNVHCKFGSWHYVAVGIRFGQNTFCVNGIKVRNNPSIRYWKTKLFLQNRILNYYQQSSIDYALLIGRGYNWTTGGHTFSGNTIDKPGVVLFNDRFDNFTRELFSKGSDWMEKLDAPLASEWATAPTPSVPELYANAKLSVYDTQWASVIKNIAVKQDDITQLQHCSPKHRTIAHGKGIYRLSKVKTAEDIGFKSDTKAGRQINRFVNKEWNEIVDIPLSPTRASAIFLNIESLPVGMVRFIDDASYVDEWIYMASVHSLDGGHYQFGLTKLESEDVECLLAKELYMFLNSVMDQDSDFQIYCWGDDAQYLFKLEDKYPDYPLGTNHAHRIIDLHELISQGEIILPGQTDNTLETMSRVMGLGPKVPVNTCELVQNIVWNTELSTAERQSQLTTLLDYSTNDTLILRTMVQKIHNEQLRQSNSCLERTS